MLLNFTTFIKLSEWFVMLMTIQISTQLNSGGKTSVCNRNSYKVDLECLFLQLCQTIETLVLVVLVFVLLLISNNAKNQRHMINIEAIQSGNAHIYQHPYWNPIFLIKYNYLFSKITPSEQLFKKLFVSKGDWSPHLLTLNLY